MGQDQSVSTQIFTPGDYTQLESTHDQRYGPVKILRHNDTQQLVCLMSSTFNSEETYQEKVQHCSGRKTLKHENLVDFVNYSGEKNEEFCSTFYKVQQLYEFLNIDLKEQIAVRSASNLRFKEGELWYLLTSCVNGLSYLKLQNIIHGDIRPSQVLLTADGRVKLGEQFQQPKPLTAYQQLLMDTRTSEYSISPALFESLNEKDYSHQYDAGANDVFSLGMTVLEAAILTTTDVCYNRETEYKFQGEKLKELLYILSQLYSPRFHSIVSRMLLDCDQERPALEDIKNELDVLMADELFKREIGLYLPIIELSSQVPVVVEEPVQERVVEKTVVLPNNYDLKEIDDRISRVLAESRETVKRYGGEKAYQAYENHERSQGYDPVRTSQLGNHQYTSQIYTQHVERAEPHHVTTTYVREPTETVKRVVRQSGHHGHHEPETRVIREEPRVIRHEGETRVIRHEEPQHSHRVVRQEEPKVIREYQGATRVIKSSQQGEAVTRVIRQSGTHNANQTKITSEDLDQQIQNSLNRSKEIENMIRTNKQE